MKSSCVPLFGVRVPAEWRVIIKQSALNLFFLPVKKKKKKSTESLKSFIDGCRWKRCFYLAGVVLDST